MNKIIFITGLMLFTLTQAKAQQEIQFTPASNFMSLETTRTAISTPGDTTGIVNDPVNYKQKSKSLRTAGLGFLGAGVLLSGIGLLVMGSNDVSSDEAGFGLAIMGLGAISGIVSIPLMVNAHVNGHKAKLLLKKQKTGFGVPSNVGKEITGITMTISIGK